MITSLVPLAASSLVRDFTRINSSRNSFEFLFFSELKCFIPYICSMFIQPNKGRDMIAKTAVFLSFLNCGHQQKKIPTPPLKEESFVHFISVQLMKITSSPYVYCFTKASLRPD